MTVWRTADRSEALAPYRGRSHFGLCASRGVVRPGDESQTIITGT